MSTAQRALRIISMLTLCLLLSAIPLSAQAAPWSGILDPSRAIDWSQAGLTGGIPNRTAVCATLNPGATAAQINSAIQNCPSGQVVYLNAGTYDLSSGIVIKSNITLRGSGADQTILKFTGTVGCLGKVVGVCMAGSMNWEGGPQNSTTWTSGYAKGATQITLGSVSGISVGTILILDQDNDFLDNNTLPFVCDNSGASNASHTACCSGDNSGSPGRTVNGNKRNQQQFVKVTAINGNQVTISPGLYMPNWSSSQNPGAWCATTNITRSGIEDMTLDHTNSGYQDFGIMSINAYEVWVKGVRSILPQRAHIECYLCSRSTFRDNYLYNNKGAGAAEAYGIEHYQGTDNLIENNICDHVTGCILNNNVSGSVFAYNFSINDTWPGGFMQPTIIQHGSNTSFNLYEGNQGPGFEADPIHGTHNLETVFRNQFDGQEPGKTSNTTPMNLYSHSRIYNIIGNVLGTANFHTNYQAIAITGNCDVSIYAFGWVGEPCGPTDPGLTSNVQPDPLVSTTVMRWGNYDTVNNGVRFVAGEVPSGLSSFANPVPGSQTLPASFFLDSKPSWFGTVPWPPIGPDVTGGNISGLSGHAYKIPAQLCYENLSSYTNFNAGSCYGNSSGDTIPPSPPRNLRIR